MSIMAIDIGGTFTDLTSLLRSIPKPEIISLSLA